MWSPSLTGARPLGGRASASARLGHGRPPLAELPCWGARGSAKLCRYALLSVFPWFSGLFSKHRSRMKVILEPMRSYLRYEHNGSCFVGFRGRLTLQTLGRMRVVQRKGLSVTQKGILRLY